MSLFSRLFRRQAPTPAPQPEQAPAAEQASPPDPAALAAQRAAEEEEALTAAIAAADQAALASLACTGFSTRIRQRAAQAIDDPARLHELIRATRGGKDKQVYRILTAKPDEVLAEQRSAERLEAEIQAASAAIERHSLRPFDALFTPTLAQLERQRVEEAALRTIVSLVRKALAALDQGSSARAARLRSLVSGQLPAAPALPGRVAMLLQRLDARLGELKDWKTFSVAPKRIELIREMESLTGSELPRPELARRIKELQAGWRTLARGAGEDLEADGQRFREAAARAFEPCREYFAQQAQVRRENLERREAMLEKLTAFAAEQDVETPNWRLIVQVLADARRQWRQHSPVDRAAAKALQARFDALAGDLQGRLDAEYDQNIKAKRTLIERAERLPNEPDTRASIEQVKTLQRQWQAVGLVPRDEENTLWTAFRQQCDAVFARREQESAAYREGLEANRARGIALCETAEGIAALSGPPLLEAAHRLEALHGEFDTLELPRTATRSLRERFERAAERCAAAVTREQALEARRVWTDLFEVANCLRGYALAVARRSDPDERATLRARTEAAMATRPDWPRDAGAILGQQLSKADAGDVPTDVAANEAVLRRLCIRAEVLTDVPTPPEDQGFRREYQLQRLVHSMGQGVSADPAQLDALALEWLAAGPVEEEAYTRLLARFERCRDTRLRTDNRGR